MTDTNGLRPIGNGLLEVTDLDAFLDSIRGPVMENLAQQADAPAERSGDGWSGSIGGACPLQGEGTLDGLPWYFRARGDEWQLGIADNPDGDPVDATFGDTGWCTGGDAEGDDDWSGSWMPYTEAWRHIEAGIAAWRTRGAR